MSSPVLVGLQGPLMGKRFPLAKAPVTFGRGEDNTVVLTSTFASRNHAEVRFEDGDMCFTIAAAATERGSTASRSASTSSARRSNHHRRRDVPNSKPRKRLPFSRATKRSCRCAASPVLRVTISGGGPVGLAFALLLEHLMGPRVAIQIFENRWKWDGDKVVWKTQGEGNIRRWQVVTIQSRQYLKLPPQVQEALFTPGDYSEMWPSGQDSIQGKGPRNIRIVTVEDSCSRCQRKEGPHPNRARVF